jgi:hypothetical protein
MDIDAQYPALSSLAQEHRYTLKKLGKMTQPTKIGYLGLGNCCYEILNNAPRWAGCDSYNYLFTLDKFLNKLPIENPAHQKLWRKLTGNQSVFLDTVVEAAWALHFWDKGLSALFEQLLDPSKPTGKDADIVVILDGTKYWLDALSVDFDQSRFSVPTIDTSSIQLPICQE